MYTALIDVDDQGRVSLPADEYHHLIRVRRAKVGELFRGLHPEGGIHLCRLEKGERGWTVQLLEKLEDNTESPFQITLAQALIKKDKFEWVVQKAVELGVQRIVPLVTDRTDLKLSPEREDRRLERWDKILREAVKQSQRTRIPTLSRVTTLRDCLSGLPGGLNIVFDEQAGMRLTEALDLSQSPGECTLFVGPEGGWSSAERDLFKDHSVQPVWLGPRILRSETAPVAVVSILQHRFGDL